MTSLSIRERRRLAALYKQARSAPVCATSTSTIV